MVEQRLIVVPGATQLVQHKHEFAGCLDVLGVLVILHEIDGTSGR